MYRLIFWLTLHDTDSTGDTETGRWDDDEGACSISTFGAMTGLAILSPS